MYGGSALRWSGAASGAAKQRLAGPLCPRRSLSSFTARTARTSVTPAINGSSLTASPLLRASFKPLPRLASARFNSTAVGAAATTGQAAAPPSNVSTETIPDLQNIDLLQIPERIGYLKELGLDYGIGPSSLMQWVLEHIHIWTGLPWAGAIICTALLTRLVLLKPTLAASDTGAKMSHVKPLTDALRTRMLEANAAGDSMAMLEARQEQKMIYQKAGVQPWKAFIPMIQIPIGFACFRILRGMATLPVPALENEGFLWMTNLTAADPLWIMPLLTGVLMHFTLKRGGETGGAMMASTGMRYMMLYGLPGISSFFMFFWPGALQLYFVTTGVTAYLQSILINTPSIRERLGMAPLVARTPAPIPEAKIKLVSHASQPEPRPTVEQNISYIDRAIERVKSSSREMKKEAMDKIDEISGQKGKDKKKARLGEQELKDAEAYEARMRTQREWERQRRNQELRARYQKKQQ